jgi:hypothetical protein
MGAELEGKLKAEYPTVFQHLDNPGSLMNFGIECGDGWFQVIWDLCRELEALGVVAEQIKEKMGCLRVYGYNLSTEAWDAIARAEERSERTCEICGKPGRLIPGGWVVVRCPECVK